MLIPGYIPPNNQILVWDTKPDWCHRPKSLLHYHLYCDSFIHIQGNVLAAEVAGAGNLSRDGRRGSRGQP